MAKISSYNPGDAFGAKDVRRLVESGFSTKKIGKAASQYQDILTKSGRSALAELGITGFDQSPKSSSLSWKKQDFGNKITIEGLKDYHKKLVNDGFSVIGANNQLLKIGASANPASVGKKALNYLAGLNQQYQSTNRPGYSGTLSGGGIPRYNQNYVQSIMDSQGKKGGKAFLWTGFNQPLKITKNSWRTGGFTDYSTSPRVTPSGKKEGDSLGVWSPYSNGTLKSTPTSSGGGSRVPRSGGGGGGFSFGGGGGGSGGTSTPPSTDTPPREKSTGLSGIFGGVGTETFGSPTFRRRRSRAQRSGSFTQGPSSLGINLQRQSGLNIMRA